jgi:valyl-tRNA synthetase
MQNSTSSSQMQNSTSSCKLQNSTSSYPLTLMETGSDILFFWVARMHMICRSLSLSLSPPFLSVALHPLVRDSRGRKMSKSLGNVVDPLDFIDGISLDKMREKISLGNVPTNELKAALSTVSKDFPNGITSCGVDALRFSLIDYLVQERAISLDPKRIIGSSQLCNKIWNALR